MARHSHLQVPYLNPCLNRARAAWWLDYAAGLREQMQQAESEHGRLYWSWLHRDALKDARMWRKESQEWETPLP